MRRLLAALGCLVLSAPAMAGSVHPALESHLSTMSPEARTSMIVMLADRADVVRISEQLTVASATRAERHRTVVTALQDAAGRSQPALEAALEDLRAAGEVDGFTSYWITNAIVFSGTADAARQIAARADVDLVLPNFTVSLIEPLDRRPAEARGEARGGSGATPGLRAINADRVWNELGITGAGRLLANCDTGVDGNHPALASRWRGATTGTPAEAWLDVLGGGGSTFPSDGNGHGTHVMGTMTGLAPATGDTIGVAWNAEWIACNAINQGAGSEFDNDIYDAYEWFADPDGNPGTTDDLPDVVQNSWRINEAFGYPDCASIWWDAIDNTEAMGVVTIWSAGNEGPGSTTIGSPADRIDSDTQNFSIGAYDATNFSFPWPIAGFSSRGPSGCDDATIKPEVSGPGVDVYSSFPGSGYGFLSGTSMSGPHVAAVVALMREANPDLEVEEIKTILIETCVDLGATGEDNTYGHGSIDAYEAVLRVMVDSGTLEGMVTHAGTGGAIEGAQVSVNEAGRIITTEAGGMYSGRVEVGTYSVTASHPAFNNGTASGVEIIDGVITVQNFELDPNPLDSSAPEISGVVQPCATDDEAGPYLVSATVTDNLGYVEVSLYYEVDGGGFTELAMDATGDDGYMALIPGQSLGSTISFYVEAHDAIGNVATVPAGAPAVTRSLQILSPIPLLTDDLETDQGWTVGIPSDDAVTGAWERADPQGTTYDGEVSQPENDHTPSGTLCFVTEAQGGSSAGDYDVDDGCTTLLSPIFDMSSATEGRVSYWRHWFDGGGTPDDDVLEIDISNDGGSSWTPLEHLAQTDNVWTQVSVSLCGLIEMTSQMQVRVVVCDDPSNSICEAALDDFQIEVFEGDVVAVGDPVLGTGPRTQLAPLTPNPLRAQTRLSYSLSGSQPVSLRVFDPQGREVHTLVDGVQAAGTYAFDWDGKNAAGHRLASGAYFVRLETQEGTFTRRITLVR